METFLIDFLSFLTYNTVKMAIIEIDIAHFDNVKKVSYWSLWRFVDPENWDSDT